MRLDHFPNLSGLSNSLYSATGGKDAARAPAHPGAAATAARPDQVSLSSAGQAAADAAAGQQALSDLTRQSLSVLGIVKPGDLAGAKISFDSLTYQASSSASLSHSHQSSRTQSANASASVQSEQDSVEFHSHQETTVAGKGHIQTADGREFEFEAALEVTSDTSFAQSGDSTTVDSGGAHPPPVADQGQNRPADLLGAAARLLDQLRQSSIAPRPASSAGAASQSPALASDPRKGDIAQYLKALDPKPAAGIDFAKLIADARDLIDQLNPLNPPNPAIPAKAPATAPVAQAA